MDLEMEIKMKLTTETIKRMINEEIKEMFDIDTGEVKEDVMMDLLDRAAAGDKEAQEHVYNVSDILKSRVGINFSIADGTPMNKKEIAKKYDLDPQTGKPQAQKQKIKSDRDDWMAKSIKSKMVGLDPEKDKDKILKLKRALAMFKGDKND